MYHPTTRVLAVLELLQTHGRLSGRDIAHRLEIAVRTVRRYIVMLQDLGIPIEAERGRYGAYALRPGFKLPPLMFTEDEALALVLGLLTVRQATLAGTAADAEGALAKVERVMPPSLRERVRGVAEVVVLSGVPQGLPPSGQVVVTLSAAAYQQQRVWLRYRSRAAAETEREVDPYGVVCREGVWYVIGYCHLRQEPRVFRVDRILAVDLREATFQRPARFNVLEHVEQALATTPGAWTIEVVLSTTLEEARAAIPPVIATLEQTPDGVLVRGRVGETEDLRWWAYRLVGLRCPVRVRQPVELRDELRTLARHAAQLADQAGPCQSY
jgi:predicted DNA-binding transcriptional regulator YafY